VTPHVLRHSFASIANDLGFTEVTIAALVGATLCRASNVNHLPATACRSVAQLKIQIRFSRFPPNALSLNQTGRWSAQCRR
jgi:hypothetical protein